jgi:hypothetical protein
VRLECAWMALASLDFRLKALQPQAGDGTQRDGVRQIHAAPERGGERGTQLTCAGEIAGHCADVHFARMAAADGVLAVGLYLDAALDTNAPDAHDGVHPWLFLDSAAASTWSGRRGRPLSRLRGDAISAGRAIYSQCLDYQVHFGCRSGSCFALVVACGQGERFSRCCLRRSWICSLICGRRTVLNFSGSRLSSCTASKVSMP